MQQRARQASQAPNPSKVISVGPDGRVTIGAAPGAAEGTASPRATYEAFKNQREELKDQLDRLENQRSHLSRQLQNGGFNDTDEKGMEQRIVQADQRIAATEKAIAEVDAKVANAAAVPGAVVPPTPSPPRQGPPEEFYVLSMVMLFVIGLPLTIAYARRIWRRSAVAISSLPKDIYDRFTKIDQSIDAIAIEVERIGENQRYLTKMQSERALSAGPAERVEVAERERERQTRK